MQPNSIVNWFVALFAEIGAQGCSSHSGRRTFIIHAARNAHKAGASLRDVQLLAGHRSIQDWPCLQWVVSYRRQLSGFRPWHPSRRSPKVIYVISGASRSGKSILTGDLAKKTGAGWFSMDALREANKRLPDGDGFRHISPLLRGVIHDHVYYEQPYIFDGGDLSVNEIAEVCVEHKTKVRACVLGYPDILPDVKFDQIRSSHANPNDWLRAKPDEVVREWITKMICLSGKLRAQCESFSVPFLNTGVPEFLTVIEAEAVRLSGL